jgi:hypothetical protein
MSDIENILVHAWNKDAVNLTTALDDVMTSKAADIINDMKSSIASAMFDQEVAPEIQNEEPQDDISYETQEIEIEEPSDEITQ